MKQKIYIPLLLLILTVSCKNQDLQVSEIEGRQLNISQAIPSNDSLESFISPYRERIAKEMNTVLAYAPESLDKTQGDLNTGIGNMMADAVLEMADPIFEQRSGKHIDIVLLNHGGIRSGISEGDVTTGTAFQLMPFENEVVVASLKGRAVMDMVSYLAQAQTAHPIAGMQLILDQEGEVIQALVQGAPINEAQEYYIATNDYLYNGGDHMEFFSRAEGMIPLDYKIRNLLIDYFTKKDTIAPGVDRRFIRK